MMKPDGLPASRVFPTTFCLLVVLFVNLRPGWSQGQLPSVFPVTLRKNLISQFAVGESYQDGIVTRDLRGANDLLTEASASVAYNLRGGRSEYSIDYFGSGRHYRRNRSLSLFTHDVGASQIRALTAHLNWTLNYRFTLTPDYAGGLLQESLARQLSFAGPLPTAPGGGFIPSGSTFDSALVNPIPAGVNLLSNTVGTAQPILGPGDGYLAVHSVRKSHRANTNLTYDTSARTSLFAGAGYLRSRSDDQILLDSDDYNVSAGFNHKVSARTEVGLSYQGSRNELASRQSRVTSHGMTASYSRQLTRSTILSLSAGPIWSLQQGHEAIQLSPLLADLLGRPVLQRDVYRVRPSWMGSVALATSWHGLNMDVNFSRSVASSSGLGVASRQERYGANIGKQLTRNTRFSVGGSFLRSEMFAIGDAIRFSQRGLDATFTRQLTSYLDFVVFARYSKFLTGVQAPYLVDHSQFGIRFQYHLPSQRQM